jgi:hypothetical protein
LYFSELPRIYYEFLKVKDIFWNFFKQKRKGFFRKYAADVSMTSALQGSWAVDGLKDLLGRKWATGLGPTGPDGGSLLILPDLLVQVSF